MDPARKNIPEEVKNRDEIPRQLQEQQHRDALRKVKNGQIIIFLVSAFIAISAAVEYSMLNGMIEVLYIFAPFFLAFFLLGVFYYRNPYVLSIVALCIYSTLLVLSAAGNPASFFKGIVIKAIIIAGLVQAIRYGKNYNIAKKRKPSSDILDEDFNFS